MLDCRQISGFEDFLGSVEAILGITRLAIKALIMVLFTISCAGAPIMTLHVIIKASYPPSTDNSKTANQRDCPVHHTNYRFAMKPNQV